MLRSKPAGIVSCFAIVLGVITGVGSLDTRARAEQRGSLPGVPQSGRMQNRSANARKSPPQAEPLLLAHLQDARILESSGLAGSARSKDLLWTHNDSGDGPYLFAINRKGETLARFAIPGATNVDWEDIALGPGENGRPALYVGDIGDNGRSRKDLVIYRVAEPEVDPARVMQEEKTELPDKFRFRYSDGPHDAETLLVHPKTGEMLIVTKEGSGVSGVYAFPMPLSPTAPVTLERVGTLTFSGRLLSAFGGRLAMGERMATGGDVSPDGKRVVVRTYLYAYEWTVPPGMSLAKALKGAPRQFLLPLTRQGEAICYRSDGKALLITSEGAHPPLYEVPLP